MKIVALTSLMLIFFSCSTIQFDKTLHCCPRVLEYEEQPNNEIITEDSKENIDNNAIIIAEIIAGAKSSITQCNRTRQKKGKLVDYKMCIVFSIESGKLFSLEIDDYGVTLEQEFHNCITSYFKNYDYSKIKSAKKVIVTRPVYIH